MNRRQADVFCLTNPDGGLLSPAVQATVLAKYSRSPLSAREVVQTLSTEEADKFQDKWAIAYSHSSVAELGSIPICFEGVSIVASKFLESFQRAGYSEKSTRYQKFSEDSFVTPPGAPDTMLTFAKRFYNAYDRLYPRVLRRVAEAMGKDPNDPAVLEERTVKARAFDNVRYLLPAGTGTSLGAVMNLRDVRYLIQQARGHSNPEIQALGEMAFNAASQVCPVLVQKADPDTFEPRIRSLGPLSQKYSHEKPDWYVDLYKPYLLPSPAQAQKSFETMVADMYGMGWTTFSKHMEARGKRAVPKAFRSFRMQFDIMMDYGAYRDLQRHRRCEQYSEPLTPSYGYLVPDDILGSDIEPDYRAVMESISAYDDERVVHDPDLMQYMIPLGYLHRSMFDMDLAEVYYVTELRTQPQGHISYRRVCYEMFLIANDYLPGLMKWCNVTKPESIGIHT
jgi:thymidylate synthase ThyX